MSDFLTYLTTTISHPLGLLAILASAIISLMLVLRIRRYGHIINELRGLPTDRRRYVLERHHKIYPGSDNKPIAFVTRQRRRSIHTLIVVALLPATGIVGAAGYQTIMAKTVHWDFDDSTISAEGYGYEWAVEVSNVGPLEVAIERIVLHVIKKRRHEVTDRKWPGYRHESTMPTEVMLRPGTKEYPIVQSTMELIPGDSRTLGIGVFAEHDPNEGWVYDVRLEFQWYLPGRTASRSRFGTTYRLGWPGHPHWSEADSTDPEDLTPIAEPVIRP